MTDDNEYKTISDRISGGRTDISYIEDNTSLVVRKRSIHWVPNRRHGTARNSTDSVSAVKNGHYVNIVLDGI